MKTIIIIIGLAVSLVACDLHTGTTVQQERAQVSVQGEARIEVVPDQLSVRLTVEATDRDLDTARNSVTRRVNAALEAIRAAGVGERELRALSIQIQPIYDWVERTQVFRGHRVARTIEFRLDDLDAWPGLVEALITARVDRIDEVRPGRSDAEELRRNALNDAVADAKSRADILARAAGATLGPAWRINEQGRGYAAPQMEVAMMRSADAAVAQWEAGTITVTATIQATFLMDTP